MNKGEILKKEKILLNDANLLSHRFILDDIKEGDKSKHYVVWSGGADSTFLLCVLLSRGLDVTTISFESDFLGNNKIAKEREARGYIKDYLNYLGKGFKEIVIKLNIDGDGIEYPFSERLGITQPEAWILQALPFIADNSYLHFGYIAHDDFWKFDDKIKTIFHNYCEMLNTSSVKLSYDLAFMSKIDIIDILSELDLVDKIWYCETAINDKPCGYCHSCREVNEALGFIEARNTIRKEDSNKKLEKCIKNSTHKVVEIN